MTSAVIEKLKMEMDSNKDNGYVQYVGNFLIERLAKHPEEADKVLLEEKTILGSLEAMRNEASKVKQNNMAMFTPDEGFKIVMNYFGISQSKAEVANPHTAPSSSPKKTIEISLDDLL